MRFYKLLHLPTGLFFKPSKYGSRPNLSKDGKAYSARKPSLKAVGTHYNHPAEPWYERRVVVPSEWVVVEYQAVEVARHAC